MAENWEDQLRNLRVEQAPEGLLDRITTVVPHLKQQAAPEKEGFYAMLLRFAGEWRYGFAVKVAAFACVAVLGVMAGQQPAQDDALGALIFGDIGWENVI
jgi:hypothetical protein